MENIQKLQFSPMTTKEELRKIEQRQKVINICMKVITYLFLIFMAIIVLIPFYWMIATALKDYDQIYVDDVSFFPTKLNWENFKIAVTTSNFNVYLKNTIFVALCTTFGSIVITILTAFAFARLNFKGKELVFSIFLATMMVPGEMFVITNYVTVARVFGWTDTYQALIVPFLVSVFYIFLLRQNFKQIPDELYYAAKIDGTGDFKYLIRIMIPLVKSTIITICILNVMGAWNSYIWPNLVQNDNNMKMISNWVNSAFSGSSLDDRPQTHLQMAASFIVTLPLLFVYIFARKFIMSGVARSGIKG